MTEMKKVILVDDEPHVIEGLTSMVDWGKYGYQVIETFHEAMKAFDYLSEHSVDLVFTDVSMPGCSGLEFARLINKKKIQTDIIMISGYREFDYVREAMEIGVVDYLVKPIFEEDVYPLLIKMNQKSEEKLKALEAQTLPVQELLLGYLETDEEIDSSLHEKLNDLNEELAEGEYEIMIKVFDGNAFFFVQSKSLELKLGPLQNTNFLPKELNLTIWSKDFSSLKELKIIYDKLKLRLRFLTRYSKADTEQGYYENKGIELNQSWSETVPDEKQEEYISKTLMWLFEEAKEDEMDDALYALMLQLENKAFSLKRIAQILYKVIILIEARRTRNRKQGESLGQELERLDFELRKVNGLEAYCRIIIEQFEMRIQLKNNINVDQENLMKQIEKYVELHLAEKLTIKELGEVLHLHPNYLGQLIRQLFGRSFVDYLHEKRITAVMKRIVETDLSIEQIAQEMGYTNYPRFLKYFKSFTGKLPTEFRRN
ncbi:MAG: response regulator [Vallitaleaceae bacterium]|nr:response regulator [Vallitaleaceae bacterium]